MEQPSGSSLHMQCKEVRPYPRRETVYKANSNCERWKLVTKAGRDRGREPYRPGRLPTLVPSADLPPKDLKSTAENGQKSRTPEIHFTQT